MPNTAASHSDAVPRPRVSQGEFPQDFDPTAPEHWGAATDEMRELRAHCPVAHSDAFNGFWLLTKHADVEAALRDSATYTTSVQNVVPKVAFTGRRPPLHLDPPEHTSYRRALNRFFTRTKVEAMQPHIRKCVVELLAPLIDAGRIDFCERFTRPLPGAIMAGFFNQPATMADELTEVTRGYNSALMGVKDDSVKRASIQLYEIAQRMIDDRKARLLDPNDDPTSALLVAKGLDGEPLPEDMVLGTLRQFIVVGMIAPIMLLGSVAVHLSEHPEVHRMLRDDLTLIPAAVQEYLRLFTPYRGFARTATHDVEIRGRTIRRHEPIALAFASADRDEEVFDNPDEFILNRPNIGRHLAFGAGAHRCAGAPLALEMLQITLEELMVRTREIKVVGEIRMSGWPEIGALSVDVLLNS